MIVATLIHPSRPVRPVHPVYVENVHPTPFHPVILVTERGKVHERSFELVRGVRLWGFDGPQILMGFYIVAQRGSSPMGRGGGSGIW